MKKFRVLSAVLLVFILITGVFHSPGLSRPVRLTVFYPSIGTIKNLQALRDKGFINISNLEITGVYHLKELTGYEEAKKYASSNQLTWISFHPVSAEISQEDIFCQNDCTPEFINIINNSDGIIFFGGPDIPPAVFKEKTSLLTVVEDPYRHYFELSAIFHFLGGSQNKDFKPLLESKPELPILGICLGAQSLNVATGGTLIQDIWSEVYGQNMLEDIIALDPDDWHNNPYQKLRPDLNLSGYIFHPLNLLPDGFFTKVLGFSEKDHPRVLSSHHQAIDQLGQDFRAVALSPDGKIVEAISHTRYVNVLGIQFHPENYRLWDENFKISLIPGGLPDSYWNLLKNNPPSIEFHRRIWQWFARIMEKNSRQETH
ncbi:MAG: gamma-glutamyl-gamma-aminobutyrate hydrolase family protein [Acidobacteriota bacterium]|nr:gamma-glutamyl-gamma-aminobutyrate hydrolase family protein [Acidobacteriota bacterium]